MEKAGCLKVGWHHCHQNIFSWEQILLSSIDPATATLHSFQGEEKQPNHFINPMDEVSTSHFENHWQTYLQWDQKMPNWSAKYLQNLPGSPSVIYEVCPLSWTIANFWQKRLDQCWRAASSYSYCYVTLMVGQSSEQPTVSDHIWYLSIFNHEWKPWLKFRTIYDVCQFLTMSENPGSSFLHTEWTTFPPKCTHFPLKAFKKIYDFAFNLQFLHMNISSTNITTNIRYIRYTIHGVYPAGCPKQSVDCPPLPDMSLVCSQIICLFLDALWSIAPTRDVRGGVGRGEDENPRGSPGRGEKARESTDLKIR